MTKDLETLAKEVAELKARMDAMEAKKKRRSTPREKTKTSEVFDCYAEAYQALYKTEPARNGMVNKLLQNLISRVGLEEAKQLATFYVQQRDAFYTKNYHPIKLLVHNCEGLLTRMRTGQKVTDKMAKKIETQTDNRTAVSQYLRQKRNNQAIQR